MLFFSPPPQRRFLWRAAIPVIAMLLQVGCQSYEPAPLDIRAYSTSLENRLIETEPVSAFARRLRATGDDVPLQFDPSDGISYAEGEVLALFYNPELRITRLQAGVALATRETAGLWEDPVFGFDGAEIISPPTPFEFGLMGSLTIPISGRLEVEKERAGAAYEAELRTVVDAEWDTRAELRRKWASWTAAVAQAELIASMIVELEKIDTIANSLQSVGELNRVERRLLQIELADRRIQATEIDLLVIETENALLDCLGLPPAAAEILLPAFPDTTITEIEDVTARLIQSNTELAVHFAKYQTAEDTLRLEITKQFPDIVIGSGYGTQFNDHRVMFGVSIPVPILNANQAAIAEATARREVVRAEAETTFERLFRGLAAANAALEIKKMQRAEYEQQIVPMLTAQTSDIQRIAELGELDMFVLLETETRKLSAKRKLIELQVRELDAAITVQQILGPEIRQNPLPTTDQAAPDEPTTELDNEIVAGDTQ
ncbi:MAG: TolC family protein [Planctomycetota bacterium]|nr:TolC family protein [Planctomycetota bacterium]